MHIHLKMYFHGWNKSPSNMSSSKESRATNIWQYQEWFTQIQKKSLVACNKSLCFTMKSTCDSCLHVIYNVLMYPSMETIEKFRFLSDKCSHFTCELAFTKHQSKNQHCLWILYTKHDYKWISGFIISTNTLKLHLEISFHFPLGGHKKQIDVGDKSFTKYTHCLVRKGRS